jgi:hypothetical protein
MREGRPVRGGAAQTRELLRRNEAISAELERRGVRSEDPQLQRALQRRGQAMPDVAASGRGDGMLEINITPDEARRQGLVGPVYHGSPDFKGRKFDPKYRARSSGLSRGGFSFTEDVASADSYAGAGVDSAQAAVDAANDVMRDLGARMEAGLKLREFADVSEVPEFNVRYADDMDELASYFNDLSKRIPKDLGARLRDAAKAVNEPANPVVVEAYLRNPKEMMINGKRLLVAENPNDIFVSAARPPQATPSAAPRGQAMPDADYRGEHSAPDRQSGAPLHKVTDNGIYPADVYSAEGARLYGTGEDAMDRAAFNMISSLQDKPNASVRVYRAVPRNEAPSELVYKYQRQKDQILRTGKIPKEAEGQWKNSSEYYDWLDKEMARLKEMPDAPKERLGIESGDWVTPIRKYAEDHGKSALRNQYKVVSKLVKARDVFTAGDSWLEWGYDPAK